jgi:hypothetical protein
MLDQNNNNNTLQLHADTCQQVVKKIQLREIKERVGKYA